MVFLTLLFLTYINIDENIINGYREILFCVGEKGEGTDITLYI